MSSRPGPRQLSEAGMSERDGFNGEPVSKGGPISIARRVLGFLDENIEKYILISLYFYITFTIVFNVFQRFIIKEANQWSLESTVVIFVYLTWIGASLGFKQRQHIRIDVIYDYVSDRTEGYLYIFSDIVLLSFSAYIIQKYVAILQNSMQYGPQVYGLKLEQWFFQLAIPIGLALSCIRLLQWLVRDVRAVRNGEPIDTGDDSMFGE